MKASFVFEGLLNHGITPMSCQESQDPQLDDGEVRISPSLYIQVSAFSNDLFLNKWIGNKIQTIAHVKTVDSLAAHIKKEFKEASV